MDIIKKLFGVINQKEEKNVIKWEDMIQLRNTYFPDGFYCNICDKKTHNCGHRRPSGVPQMGDFF